MRRSFARAARYGRKLTCLGGAVLRHRLKIPLGHDRIFGAADNELWFALHTSGYRRYKALRDLLPGLPDDATQRAFIGSAGDGALGEAFSFYEICLDKIAALGGRPLGRDSRVLDFGCGWGRTIRFFMRDVPVDQLVGVDCMPRAIDLARQTNPWCRFALIPPLPPLEGPDFPSAGFDLIYLYSVFSHLSEEAHELWLREFHRLLRPGGLLLATTWAREYIIRCGRARHGDTLGTHPGSLGAFQGTTDWLARYDRGEFCHSPVGGGDALSSSFYGESCIPRPYVEARWSRTFRALDYVEADGRRLWQNLIVAGR